MKKFYFHYSILIHCVPNLYAKSAGMLNLSLAFSIQNNRYSFANRRKYSAIDTTHDLSHKFVSCVLNALSDPNNVLVNNPESQLIIENIIFDEYEDLFSRNTTKYIVGGINTDILGPMLSKYLMDKELVLNKYIDNLLTQQAQVLTKIDKLSDKNKFESILIAKVIISIGKKFIHNLCLYHFLVVYSYQNTQSDKNYASVAVSIKMAKKMFNKYINILKDDYIQESKNPISFTFFHDKWKNENPKLALIVDDNFYVKMGCKLIDILLYSDILSMTLVSSIDKEHPYQALQVKDKTITSTGSKQAVINLPLKLPMICPPKYYGDNVLGGYLLNDVSDKLVIDKKAYKVKSELSTDNKIYSLVNNISTTPFKINIDLLDYICNPGVKQNLLIDPYAKHKFSDLEKLTKYQKGVLASYNSKVVLQESILGIAEFYRKFSKIYFPLRIDQRGRMYCTPSYFNYQSNELSKALILFADPGVVHRNKMDSIIYLKAYGANCYGGAISKASIKAKLE